MTLGKLWGSHVGSSCVRGVLLKRGYHRWWTTVTVMESLSGPKITALIRSLSLALFMLVLLAKQPINGLFALGRRCIRVRN